MVSSISKEKFRLDIIQREFSLPLRLNYSSQNSIRPSPSFFFTKKTVAGGGGRMSRAEAEEFRRIGKRGGGQRWCLLKGGVTWRWPKTLPKSQQWLLSREFALPR